MSPIATGNVYIFNTTGQHITLILNSNPVFTATNDVPPAAPSREENYAPSAIIVPRSNATQIYDPVFAQSNTLHVMFQGVLNRYDDLQLNLVTSPSNNDLVLYIYYGYLLLVDTVSNQILYNKPPS